MAKIYIFAILLICLGSCIAIPGNEAVKSVPEEIAPVAALYPLLPVERRTLNAETFVDNSAAIAPNDRPIIEKEATETTDDNPDDELDIVPAASSWHGGYGRWSPGYYGGGWGRQHGGYGGGYYGYRRHYGGGWRLGW